MGSMYRMPVGFGPSLGPRQGPCGRRFTDETVTAFTMEVSFATRPDAMASLLPPRFYPAVEPIVTLRLRYYRDVPWLAGRGYNYLEVLLSSEYRGNVDRESGNFVAVMWENLAEPIIVGREEAGHPKLFADISAPISLSASTVGGASWSGFPFFEMELEGSLSSPLLSSTPRRGAGSFEASPLTNRPRLNYKYIPNSESLEEPEVSQVVFIPSGIYQQRTLESWQGEGHARFQRATWHDLPTFYNLVNGLVELPPLEWGTAFMQKALIRSNDLRDSMRILK